MTYSRQPEESSAVTGLNGSLNVKATSSLPFNLENCRLVIGMSQAQASPEGTSRNRGVTRFYQTHTNSGVQIEQVDSIAEFGTLSPSVPVSIATAPGTWASITARDDQYWRNRNGQFIPQTHYSGATGIWIVAGIVKSPILSIDEQRSDFEPLQEQHWYVQEILPEQISAEWLELTHRLLDEQIKAAAAQAAAELDEK